MNPIRPSAKTRKHHRRGFPLFCGATQAGALVLAAGFDEEDNLAGWWEAIIVKVDDDEFLVRWRNAQTSQTPVVADNILLCSIPGSPSFDRRAEH